MDDEVRMTRSEYVGAWKIVILTLVVVLLIVGLFVGGCAGLKAFNRAQKRADANNNVSLTHTKIQQVRQRVKINRVEIEATKAEAEKRYQESIGIRRAQDEISKTLTPLYVQHEAIQAQGKTAGQERVYIPVGPQGIPLVNNVSGQRGR